jgi:serine/threonine-protein phosphatase 4 regulatory subunit 1
MVRNVGIGQKHSVTDMLGDKTLPKMYDSEGYKVVTGVIAGHLQTLLMDPDVDVRRSASDTLAGLAFHIRKDDVAAVILPIPLKFLRQQTGNSNQPTKGKKNRDQQQQSTQEEGLTEELRITAANLLAELGGAGENEAIPRDLVRELILPAVLTLCRDPGFRVRRAAAQALPRVLGGTSVEDARNKILPAFTALSKDEVYRVRKSTGECLVDMSRSMMILVKTNDPSNINALRRQTLIPIAENLLADSNKFVRHGMMQFLGPFLASFYPFVYSALKTILPGTSESDGSNHSGIVAQFFPQASSMVSRLNSSAAATTSAPTPTLSVIDHARETPLIKELQQTLPHFVHSGRASSISLKAVVTHRSKDPPDPEDIEAVMGQLLDHFTGLAKVNTGDDNTDAEMRVYCAYSYPAVVLLLGPENWEGRLKDCFKTLLNPNYHSEEKNEATPPPLPVKRCLASSLHTVAHILGSEIAASDILPIFCDHFLTDTDESVRLNMIRNFPTLLASMLDAPLRNQYILQWCETVRGEEVLGALKRSATNPLVLNWRQRDYVSRSLSDLIVMVDAVFAYNHLWPILKLVLTDSISLVREDAIWAIPILLKSFAIENILDLDGATSHKAKDMWSVGACQEVIKWLKETILKVMNGSKGKGSNGKAGNFSQRQLYCQVCTAMALALRFGDGLMDPDDPVMELEAKFSSNLQARNSRTMIAEFGPYRKLTNGERKHILRLLIDDLLPVALEFKDDRVTNVRLALRKTLLLMPDDVAELPAVKETVQCLQEEVETWESFDGIDSPMPPPVQPMKGPTPIVDVRQANATASGADDIQDTGMVKGSKRKVSKREKKKGTENSQEQGNGMRSDTLASI